MSKHLGQDFKAADKDKVNEVANKVTSASDGGAFDSDLAGVSTQQAPLSGNTSIHPDQYKGNSPDVVSAVDRTKGFSSMVAALPLKNERNARGATEIDLANLNESNMMDIPFIEAKSYEIASMLEVKAKDPVNRFRWVNYKNNEGGNYQMFKAIGFTNATAEDVDQKLTPLGENLIRDDNSIKYYDVILMKVNVIRLMQAYKANVVKSLNAVGRWNQSALAEAKRTFNNEVSPDMVAAMKQQGLSVDFYIPSKDEFKIRNAKGDMVEA